MNRLFGQSPQIHVSGVAVRIGGSFGNFVAKMARNYPEASSRHYKFLDFFVCWIFDQSSDSEQSFMGVLNLFTVHSLSVVLPPLPFFSLFLVNDSYTRLGKFYTFLINLLTIICQISVLSFCFPYLVNLISLKTVDFKFS